MCFKKIKSYLMLSVATAAVSASAIAHEAVTVRPDDHAPIGVMGDHMHKRGEWMLSYRYKRMNMKGSRDGTDQLSTEDVHQQFPVAPLKMTMQMHMFGAMYAPSDNVTVMAMVPYVIKEMDMVTRPMMGGVEFSTRSEGVGDVKLASVIKLSYGENYRLHLNAGLSVPTGAINERDDTPAMANARLPYGMQTGSGTYDLLPGITYIGRTRDLSWGGQISGVIRLGKNDNDYTLGDRLTATAWVAKPINNWLSGSVRSEYSHWANVSGADLALNPMMTQGANTDMTGGDRVDMMFGLNAYVPNGSLAGNRLALEVSLPVYQNLNGPQMEADWSVTVGWQLAF